MVGTFDPAAIRRVKALPPIRRQRVDVDAAPLDFLAFTGFDKQGGGVQGYDNGSPYLPRPPSEKPQESPTPPAAPRKTIDPSDAKHGFDVSNTWGRRARGEYGFMYGTIYDGEGEVHGNRPHLSMASKHMVKNPQEFEKSLQNMQSGSMPAPKKPASAAVETVKKVVKDVAETVADAASKTAAAITVEDEDTPVTPALSSGGAKESMKGKLGPVISKNGKKSCTPGYKLVDGKCVAKEDGEAVCMPGWEKVNGRCVKSPKENSIPNLKREKMTSQPEDRKRMYIQEVMTGDASVNPITVVLGVAVAGVLLGGAALVGRKRHHL
jgi:hypothetical protein